jgi:hypothetical protein
MAQQKRDAEQAYQKMSAEEKLDFKRKIWQRSMRRVQTTGNPRHLASPPIS